MGGIALKLMQSRKCRWNGLDWNKDMVMVRSCHDIAIAADVPTTQRCPQLNKSLHMRVLASSAVTRPEIGSQYL
jgi:hypothetical protein